MLLAAVVEELEREESVAKTQKHLIYGSKKQKIPVVDSFWTLFPYKRAKITVPDSRGNLFKT